MRLQLNDFFAKGITLSEGFRRQQLTALKQAIKNNESEISDALILDLNKSTYESWLTELGLIYAEIDNALKNLRKWMRPKSVRQPLMTFPSKSKIYPEPKGTVLIISPWNYPFMLTFCPLVGAIAAGNCAVIKPSELAPASAAAIQKIITEAFNPDYCRCITGGVDIATKLLEQKWDHIFFTGSSRVGRIVMEAASRHPAPVTLELGGKSPAIVHHDANIARAAIRIAWGKLINAGQTCIAPDYLFVHNDIIKDFTIRLAASFKMMTGDIAENEHYPVIINKANFERLCGYMRGATIAYGGQAYPDSRKISPTIILSPDKYSPVMTEEIFGPILPVMGYDDISDAARFINSKSKPLALYLFTSNKNLKKEIIKKIPFGGGCVNDTLLHISNLNLPFGGTGESGMGHYRGRHSFETFSHMKGIVERGTWIDFSVRFPPFKDNMLKLLKKLM